MLVVFIVTIGTQAIFLVVVGLAGDALVCLDIFDVLLGRLLLAMSIRRMRRSCRRSHASMQAAKSLVQLKMLADLTKMMADQIEQENDGVLIDRSKESAGITTLA